MKRLLINAAALALCASAFLSCKELQNVIDKFHKEDPAPEPVCVKVQEVSATDDVSLRTFVGRVEPSQNFVLTAPFPAKVMSINIKKGRQATAGEVIAVLKSETVESTYEMARATLDQARDAYERMMKIYPGGVTEIQKMEMTTNLRKAEASFKAAQDALDKCTVKAPYSGIVDEVYIEEGVDLALSSPIAKILNVSDVEIHFPVPENEIKAIRVGDRAQVTVPAADASVAAKVIVRGVDASALSHSYDCVLIPDRACPDILPGMVCKVRLNSYNGRRIIVPMSSVMTDSRGRYVWCVDDNGIVLKTPVITEGFASDGVIVSEGLVEGDLLVVEGHRKVSGGMKVKVERE